MTTITDAMRSRAVTYALAQVGKPYRFGAKGPDAFDCSGLPLAAWGQVGVILPHNSEQQAEPWFNSYGRFVAFSEANAVLAKYGDLIVYYPDWSHIGMFTGKDSHKYWLVTQATNEQRGVETIRAAAYTPPLGIVFMGHQ